MSVLIKGMDMPMSCDICPFSKTNDDLMSDDYRFRYCDFPYIGEFVTDYTATRHPDCPLVEIKAPHGRLIDAKAFETENAYFWGRDFINTIYEDTLADLVNAAPTIIEAEGKDDVTQD